MKKAKTISKFIMLSLVLTVLLSFVAAFSAFAEPDETYAVESFVAETTEVPDETLPEEVSTQATELQEATTESQESSTVSGTDSGSTSSQDGTHTVATETDAVTEPSYRAPLPTVENTEVVLPTVVGAVEKREEPSLFWGFVSWILIGVGLAVIFAVVLSTKAKTYRGGRDRYSSTDKISGKKKLLSQDYYDKRKLK